MKNTLKILLWSSVFLNLSAGLFGPIYAVFVEQIGGDLLTAGGAYASFSIALGVLVYFLGKWEDKIKHQENLIIWGRLLTVIGTAGYLLIKAPIHLFAVQITLGIAQALTIPAFDSLYSKNLQKGRFASQWGSWEAMTSIVIGIAAIVGGLIAKEFGFKPLFIIMTIIALIALIISLLLKKDVKRMLKEEFK